MTARPIDTSLFVAAGPDVRSFAKQTIIDAPPDEVWAVWATAEGWSRAFAEPAAADIELSIGGPYEWLFDGSVGSNDCQVLSYIPGRMISFSWNAPPEQPASRALRTWVVVEIEAEDGGGTRLRLTHLGFGTGPDWDETYAYFDEAWDRVFRLLEHRLVSDS